VVNGINDAQELSKTHFQVTMARVRVWHTLRNHYLTPNFPEIDRFIRSDRSVWLVQLLARLSDASLDYCLERRGVDMPLKN
jgi:transposase